MCGGRGGLKSKATYWSTDEVGKSDSLIEGEGMVSRPVSYDLNDLETLLIFGAHT